MRGVDFLINFKHPEKKPTVFTVGFL